MPLPALGLGTWQNTDPDTCRDSVQTAIEAGYRHVDTAQYYGNEVAVGEGIAAADVPRDEVFVASKVHADKFGLAYDEVIEGLEVTLDRLGLDSLDLLYVHWPVGNYDPAETMSAFDELVDRGLTDHVGVCNFSVELLDEAMAALESPLFAHQAETHPLLPQDELVEHAQEHGYNYVAYSPLARGEILDEPVITDIADARNVSPAAVTLAWNLARDAVHVIPKATGEAHIRDNLTALDVELSTAELGRIDDIDRTERFVERDGAPWLDE